MANQNPYSVVNQGVVAAVVQNPVLNSLSPTGQTPFMAGQSGDLLVSEIHEKWYNASLRGNVFLGSTLIAGTVIPVNAVNVVSTCTLWNPPGSGKNFEPIEYAIGIDSATEVVNGLVTGFQSGLATAGGTLTARTGASLFLGGGLTPQGVFYSAATLVNAAVLTPLLGMGMNVVATSASTLTGSYKYEGKIVMPPGSLITILSTVAAMTAAFQSLTWAEWPV